MWGKGKSHTSMQTDQETSPRLPRLGTWAGLGGVYTVCKQTNALRRRQIKLNQEHLSLKYTARDMCFPARHIVGLCKLSLKVRETFFSLTRTQPSTRVKTNRFFYPQPKGLGSPVALIFARQLPGYMQSWPLRLYAGMTYWHFGRNVSAGSTDGCWQVGGSLLHQSCGPATPTPDDFHRFGEQCLKMDL